MPAEHVARAVQRLRIYPLKGARAVDLTTMAFDEKGPVGDRRWMVVREDGLFVSQRESAGLAEVDASITAGALSLNSPRAGTLTVAEPHAGAGMVVQIWTSTLEVRAAGPEADAWVSEALAGSYRLVYMAPEDRRDANPDYAPGQRVSFVDGYPALVVTDASVREISRRVGREIPLERFRPNIVISSADPHEEDRWRRFKIGTAAFEGVKQCLRCRVTTVDQSSGQIDSDGEPLRTLSQYRRTKAGVWFGTNAVTPPGAAIQVGDPVDVVDWGAVPAPDPA